MASPDIIVISDSDDAKDDSSFDVWNTVPPTFATPIANYSDNELYSVVEESAKELQATKKTKKPNMLASAIIEQRTVESAYPHEPQRQSSRALESNQTNMVDKIFSHCLRLANDDDDSQIVTKMQKRILKQCDLSYITSKAFADYANRIYDDIIKNPANRHVHLKELLVEITAVASSPSQVGKLDPVTKHVKTSEASVASTSTAAVASTSAASDDNSHQESKTEKIIRKLEKLLKACNKKIYTLETRELDLDDLDDDQSDYVMLDKYKRKSIAIWKKLCELTGRKKISGRSVERKFIYRGSRYEPINEEITKMLKILKFPDFFDVFDLVKKCNDNRSLHLLPFAVHSTAIQVFEDIGKQLKQRRIEDYREDYGCPWPELIKEQKDPIESDIELQNKCAKNREIANIKREEVFQSFTLKQDELEHLRRSSAPTSQMDYDECDDCEEDDDDDDDDNDNDKDDDDDDDDDGDVDDNGNSFHDNFNKQKRLVLQRTVDDNVDMSDGSDTVDTNRKQKIKKKPSSIKQKRKAPADDKFNRPIFDPRASAVPPIKRPLVHVLPTIKQLPIASSTPKTVMTFNKINAPSFEEAEMSTVKIVAVCSLAPSNDDDDDDVITLD